MCGFAALLAVSNISLAHLRAMCDAVAHRGPDDEGYLLLSGENNASAFGGADTPADCFDCGLPYAPSRSESNPAGFLGLGHRRLAIVDVSSAGHQPMSYADNRFWLVFNGEIYNFIELRDELSRLGYRFHNGTDTEVILAAYQEWGRECLTRFNGMWAIALIDRSTRKFLVARDRWGIKPLYYWVSPAGFIAFASEIKQFCGLPGWSAKINGQRAYDFLNWRVTDHTRETLFDGVFQLRGGERFEADWGELTARRQLPYEGNRTLPATRWYNAEPAPFEGNFKDAADGLRALLIDSVRLRLRADVPVGSCLSGGLDSSSIVCAMDTLLAERGGGIQKTFTAGSADPRFDERSFADEVVRSTRVQPHYVCPRLEGVFDELNALVWHQDEPFTSTSVYAQWNVFRLARQNDVVVMLDGQGADEQLAGYHTFFAPLFAGLFTSLRAGALLREVRAAKQVHGYSEVAAARQIATMVLPPRLRRAAMRVGGRTQLLPDWLDVDRLGAEPSDPFAAGGARTSDVLSLSLAQLTSTNLQMLLHWEDRDSMAHSIEARIPFLDYRLVEFVLGLPTEFKISGGVTKRVLREAVRGLVPERVRTRMDKMGFLTAEQAWVREQQPERFRTALRQAIDSSHGILRPSATRKLERIIAGTEPWEYFAWRMITFGAWMDRFSVSA